MFAPAPVISYDLPMTQHAYSHEKATQKRRVEVIGRMRLYDGYFKLDQVRLRYQLDDGGMSPAMDRLVFERGDSVAVLLYDRERDTVLLVEQFRYPAFARGDGGWLLEIVAGMLDEGGEGADVARRELVEEAGLAIDELVHLMDFYPSPGACTERIALYLGYLDQRQRVGAGGGVDQGEDIRLVELDFQDAWRMVCTNQIRDAKTIIALQHLAMQRAEAGS